MHGDQSPKTFNFQQQKKQLKPCETYKQSYNAKPKYALDNQPKTTTGQTKEKMFEFKTKKPEESSSNWKPWHKDWDAITSNHSEDDAIKDDGKYRYNRKGFLEDDESSDDSILIVDPGWDDYCLQELKLNRPVPLCPEARRAQSKRPSLEIASKFHGILRDYLVVDGEFGAEAVVEGKELFLGEDATWEIPNMGLNLVNVERVCWIKCHQLDGKMEDVRKRVVMWECPYVRIWLMLDWGDCFLEMVMGGALCEEIGFSKTAITFDPKAPFQAETLQDYGRCLSSRSTFSQDLDLLEQHLTKDILSRTDCTTTLTDLRTTFENAFNSELKALQKFNRFKFYIGLCNQMTETYFVNTLDSRFKTSEYILKTMSKVKKSVAKRTCHQRQYDRRVNKRQLQTQESKIDMGKALDADLGGIPTGKLFDSCTSKVDSEPPHGSNVDTPHIHECKQTLDVSAGTSINVQKEQSLDLSAVHKVVRYKCRLRLSNLGQSQQGVSNDVLVSIEGVGKNEEVMYGDRGKYGNLHEPTSNSLGGDLQD
ncbi:hypothetical protein Tco_0255638 [Tanacetum coccineum]